jgi:aryl-alcohol dehydrogenase-like predicted oxidoreductase
LWRRTINLRRIGLGTAQFGTQYGISNHDGRPTEAEVAAILVRAAQAEFGYVDTAVSYAGAETLIGRHLPAGHGLRIITKLPPIVEDAIEARHGEAMLSALASSLEQLRVDRIYGLLIHQPGDLAKSGWQYLTEAMREAKARGWTSRIGISVYDASDLSLVEARFVPDLVQLPINVLDRRLVVSGWIERLKAQGVEVHARSLFLQGLLLIEPAALPGFFSPVQQAVAKLRARWAAENVTPLCGCLQYVLHTHGIDAAIIGVNRLSELHEIEAALDAFTNNAAEFELEAAVDPIYLDPRRWPSFAN